MSTSLYELTGQFQYLYDLADDPDIDPQVWQDTIEAIDMEIEEKADNIAKLIAQLNAEATALKSEEKRLADKRKAKENKIDSLKKYLQDAMIKTEKRKFSTQLFSFNIQKNPPRTIIDVPLNEVPEQYLIPQDPKVDMYAVKENIANLQLQGIAHQEHGESLCIK